VADQSYYYNGATTTPHGTALATPLVTDIPLLTIQLHSVRVRMPPGPLGNLGFAFHNADAQIIPYSTTPSYVIGDDEVWEFVYAATVGVMLALWTYNTGSYDHELLYEIDYTPIAASSVVAGGITVVTVPETAGIPPVDNIFQDFGVPVAS